MTTDPDLICHICALMTKPGCNGPATHAYISISTRMVTYYCEEHAPLVRGLEAITIEEALVTEVMNE